MKQPATEGFYERNYSYEGGQDKWIKDYFDGKQWYWTKGGRLAILQVREWREITKEGK